MVGAVAFGLVFVVLALSTVPANCGRSTANTNYEGGASATKKIVGSYRAGTALHYPLGTYPLMSGTAIVKKNIDAYVEYLAGSEASNLDIAAFPESGTGFLAWDLNRTTVQPWCEEIPDVENGSPYVVPCTDPEFSGDDHYQLRVMSCAAIQYNTYIVFNLGEIMECVEGDPDCPLDGHYQFNVAVAISRTGQLLSKYRKSHLANEADMFDQPVNPDPVFFDTDFGVRFGLLICYDGNFAQPTRYEYSSFNVRDFIWVMFMGDLAPLISSTETQAGWSWFYESNLIASNGYYTGCGIYSNGTVIASLGPYVGPQRQFLVGSLTIHTSNPTGLNSRQHSAASSLPIGDSEQIESTTCKMGGTPFPCQVIYAEKGVSGVIDINATSPKFGTQLCHVEYHVSDSSESGIYVAAVTVINKPGLPGTPDGVTVAGCALMSCSDYPQCEPECPQTDPYCLYNPTSIFDSFTVSALLPPTFASNLTMIFPIAGVGRGQPIPTSSLILSLHRYDLSKWQQIQLVSGTNLTEPLFSAGFYVEQQSSHWP
ncbi:Vanin protein [Pelomyxa schiedti]|nr:Vanin protein [Pelomyxa schiedti]